MMNSFSDSFQRRDCGGSRRPTSNSLSRGSSTDQLDRLDPVANPRGRRAAAPDELLELVAKRRREAIDEPRHELAAFPRGEPDTRVWPDHELHAPADQLAVAIGAGPAVAPPCRGDDLGVGMQVWRQG